MTISVIGVGGVGGYFGGKLALAAQRVPGLRIAFLARGAHLEAIKRDGLVLDAEESVSVCVPALATDDPSLLPPSDLYLVCVKGYDLENALSSLAPFIPDGASMMPLLNGVDIAARVRSAMTRAALPRVALLPACVYVGTKIEKPGTVKQRGGEARIIFGPERPGLPVDARVREAFDTSGIRYAFMDDPWPEIWMKYLFISSFSLVCAEAGATLGQVAASESLMARAKAVMAEIVALARAKGVALPEDAIELTAAKPSGFPASATTSFYRDYVDPERKDERDVMGYAILRMGKEIGVGTPLVAEIMWKLEREKPLP